jgi:hypothetical protein
MYSLHIIFYHLTPSMNINRKRTRRRRRLRTTTRQCNYWLWPMNTNSRCNVLTFLNDIMRSSSLSPLKLEIYFSYSAQLLSLYLYHSSIFIYQRQSSHNPPQFRHFCSDTSYMTELSSRKEKAEGL